MQIIEVDIDLICHACDGELSVIVSSGNGGATLVMPCKNCCSHSGESMDSLRFDLTLTEMAMKKLSERVLILEQKLLILEQKEGNNNVKKLTKQKSRNVKSNVKK